MSNSTFTGGEQGWVSLKLESVENLSHNVKKFRFVLPNSGDVSGLHVACTFIRAIGLGGCIADCVIQLLF